MQILCKNLAYSKEPSERSCQCEKRGENIGAKPQTTSAIAIELLRQAFFFWLALAHHRLYTRDGKHRNRNRDAVPNAIVVPLDEANEKLQKMRKCKLADIKNKFICDGGSKRRSICARERLEDRRQRRRFVFVCVGRRVSFVDADGKMLALRGAVC